MSALGSSLYILNKFLQKSSGKQECIPVKCVPSAAVAVCLGGGGCLPRGGCLPGMSGGVCLSVGGCLPIGRVYQFAGSACGGVCPRGGVCLGGVHLPPVDRILDTCL